MHKQRKTFVANLLNYSRGLFFGVLALGYLSFAYGSASGDSGVQTIPALIGSLAFGYSAIRSVKCLPTLSIIFWGTLPLWLVHIPMTLLLDDESPIFLITSGIAPAIAGITWLFRKSSR